MAGGGLLSGLRLTGRRGGLRLPRRTGDSDRDGRRPGERPLEGRGLYCLDRPTPPLHRCQVSCAALQGMHMQAALGRGPYRGLCCRS